MGKVFKYDHNVDTDVIIPARYLNTQNPAELAQYCMIDLDADFHQAVEEGDMIVAGDNFGCGSSREHAPMAIKASGVKCVIAKNFARIFYRNAFNIGLPILESVEAYNKISAGDYVTVDLKTGLITNQTKGEEYQAQKIPAFMEEIIAAGGLIDYLRKQGNQ